MGAAPPTDSALTRHPPQITLGRATKDNQIDVDLSLEGPAWKISRKQGSSKERCECLPPSSPWPPPPPSHPPLSLCCVGVIKLKNNGDFFIANEGRRPIYIDGRPVLCGSKWRLSNNSVVEVRRGGRQAEPGAWGAGQGA